MKKCINLVLISTLNFILEGDRPSNGQWLFTRKNYEAYNINRN